jgi:hypothetical protein
MHPPFDLLCDIASSIVAVENGWMVDLESLRRDITDTSGFASRVAGCEPRSGAEWTGLAGACERLENVLDDLEHGDVSGARRTFVKALAITPAPRPALRLVQCDSGD